MKMKFKLVEHFYITEDIASMQKMYPDIPEKDFMRYISLDPTYTKGSNNPGKYARWILDLVKRGNFENEGHIKDLISRFDTEKKNLINKDIMRYKTVDDLEAMLNDDASYAEKTHRQEVRDRQNARRNADLTKDADKVYEDSKWEVWIPKSYEASCKLGQGASWCTASTESDYYYKYYKNRFGGDYYIIINKTDPEEKYQFHFESRQFMNADDHAIHVDEFLNKEAGLKEFFTPMIEARFYQDLKIDKGTKELTITLDADDIADHYEGDFERSFVAKAFRGDLWDKFWDYADYVDTDSVADAFSYINDENKETIAKLCPDIDMSASNTSIVNDLEELYPKVYNVLNRAVGDAEVIGAANEAEKDFLDAVEVPSYVKDWSNYYEEFTFTIDVDKLKETYMSALDSDEYDEEIVYDVYENLETNLAEYIGSHLRVYEPSYGWYGFDKDDFNMILTDYLHDVK